MDKNNKHINFFDDELKDSELLSKLKGSNTFITPDNYFQDLESDIINKIDTKTIGKKGQLTKYILFAVAASVTIIMVFVGLQYNKTQKQRAQIVENIDSKIDNVESKDIKLINNKKNNEQILAIDSVKPSFIEPKQNKTNIYIATDDSRVNEPSYKRKLTKDNSTRSQIITEDNDNSQDEYNEVIADNNSNDLMPNSISGIESSSSSQIAIRTLTRRFNNAEQNTFLPKDTCVNKPFVYHIDTIGFGNKLEFIWDNNKGISSRISKSGSYSLQYWFNDSLIGVDSMKVIIVAKPQPIIKCENEICNHESLLLNAGMSSEDYTYKWSVSDLNRSEVYISNLKTGDKLIELEVSSCADTVHTEVLVRINDCKLMIPNVFTPNGDGINDYFFIKGLDYYPGSSLTILDRKGAVVYQSLDYKNNWKADNLANGTYFYSLIINDKAKTEKGGIISILR